MGWGWGRIWWKTGRSESEVNYLRSLCGMLGKRGHCLLDVKAERGTWGCEGSSAHSAWPVSGISGHQEDLWFDAPFRRMLSA